MSTGSEASTLCRAADSPDEIATPKAWPGARAWRDAMVSPPGRSSLCSSSRGLGIAGLAERFDSLLQQAKSHRTPLAPAQAYVHLGCSESGFGKRLAASDGGAEAGCCVAVRSRLCMDVERGNPQSRTRRESGSATQLSESAASGGRGWRHIEPRMRLEDSPQHRGRRTADWLQPLRRQRFLPSGEGRKSNVQRQLGLRGYASRRSGIPSRSLS